MFLIPELRMRFLRRIFTASSSFSSTCPNSNRGCKVSSFPHLSGRTTTQIDHIPALSLCTFFSPSIFFPLPYSKRRLFSSSKYPSSAARSYPTKAGSLTRAMPDRPKSKSKNKNKNKSTASKEVDISKGLSYLLRHGAKNEGLRLDEGGWANVAHVVGFFVLFLLFFGGVVGFIERSLLCLTCVSVVFVKGIGLESSRLSDGSPWFLIKEEDSANDSMISFLLCAINLPSFQRSRASSSPMP